MKKYLYLFAFLLVATAVWGTTQSAFAADTVLSSDFLDVDVDGTVDTIRITMDETVLACPSLGNWTIDTAGDIGVTAITGITCRGTNQYINLAITASAGVTGGTVDPIISYGFTPGGAVTLTSGFMTSKPNMTIVDMAVPVITTFRYRDTDADGMVDDVNLRFSEAVMGTTSTFSASNLLFTDVGDFTGVVFGPNATDLLTNGAAFMATNVTLGTEASVIDTHENSGTLAFSLQGFFSLSDDQGNINSTPAAQSQVTVIDSAAPVVVSTTPVDGDTGVAVDAPVVLTFSESMDTTPSFTTFATSPVVTHAVTWSSNDTVATFDHTVDYANSTAVSATLSDARDDIGNAIAGSTFVDFTTAAAPSTNSGGHSVSSVRNIVYGFNAPVVVPTNTLRTALAAMTGLLKMGMNNDWVKTLQTFINTYATPTPLLVVDGAFGPKTDAAVKSFQAAQGIKIDGIVGPQTRTEMIAEIK